MRYILYITLVMLLSGCQKARLVEECPDNPGQNINGRNGTTEQSDTINVTPKFDVGDWEGTIDAEFEFGGEENE